MVLSSSEGDNDEDSDETVEEGDAGRVPPRYHCRFLRDLVDDDDDMYGQPHAASPGPADVAGRAELITMAAQPPMAGASSGEEAAVPTAAEPLRGLPRPSRRRKTRLGLPEAMPSAPRTVPRWRTRVATASHLLPRRSRNGARMMSKLSGSPLHPAHVILCSSS